MRSAIFPGAVLFVLIAGPLTAVDSAFAESAQSSIEVDVVFTDEEVRLIRAHYQSEAGSQGHGHGKPKTKGLPPGIAKNLARGKPLPPGIAKQALPYELRRVLPPVRDGYERVIVDGKILLVEIATQLVRDVLTDIVLD